MTAVVSAITRTGITAADAGDTSAASLIGASGAGLLGRPSANMVFSVEASCDAPDQTLTLALALYGGLGAPAGPSTLFGPPRSVTEPSSFTSGPLTDGAGRHFCPRQFVDAGLGGGVYPFVLSVSGGAWTVVVVPVGDGC